MTFLINENLIGLGLGGNVKIELFKRMIEVKEYTVGITKQLGEIENQKSESSCRQTAHRKNRSFKCDVCLLYLGKISR